jgi:hypothetical protein
MSFHSGKARLQEKWMQTEEKNHAHFFSPQIIIIYLWNESIKTIKTTLLGIYVLG